MWATVLSWIEVSAPMVMGAVVAAHVTPGETVERAPTLTRPMTVARSWTQASGGSRGEFFEGFQHGGTLVT